MGTLLRPFHVKNFSSGKVSIFRSDRKVYRSKSGHDKPAYSLNKSADNSEHVRIYDDPLFNMLRMDVRNDRFRESVILTVSSRMHNWRQNARFAVRHKHFSLP